MLWLLPHSKDVGTESPAYGHTLAENGLQMGQSAPSICTMAAPHGDASQGTGEMYWAKACGAGPVGAPLMELLMDTTRHEAQCLMDGSPKEFSQSHPLCRSKSRSRGG